MAREAAARPPEETLALWKREQALLKARVVDRDTEAWQRDPAFSGLHRVGGVDVSYVKGDSARACASLRRPSWWTPFSGCGSESPASCPRSSSWMEMGCSTPEASGSPATSVSSQTCPASGWPSSCCRWTGWRTTPCTGARFASCGLGETCSL
ncbi:endonuclease V [Phyllostomus discolor]|uniref:Endonuclease V n=1 Tax=Phyllostomus discolor TaxID=89673 RepID=A0A833ZJ40_9CHIR|nr:endonuclease V [Phyllostomus discolor]